MTLALASDFTTVLQHRRGLELLESVIDMTGGSLDRGEAGDRIRLLGLAAAVAATVAGAAAARTFIERAEALLVTADRPDAYRARLLCLRAELAFDGGDLAAATEQAEQSRALAARVGLARIELQANHCLSNTLLESGKLEEADRLAATVPVDVPWLGVLATMVRGVSAVERGAYAIATSIGRAELQRCRGARERDSALEAVFLLVAADPIGNRELVSPELAAFGDGWSWIAKLQLNRCLIAYLLLDRDHHAASVMAADTAVIAASLPHRWEQIEANLLLGDAATAGADLPQALRSYDDALTAAVEHGSVLRAADALDGYAAALPTIDAAGGRAAAAAARLVRRAHGAAPRPRPWPQRADEAVSGQVPMGWVRHGKATQDAVVALRRAAALGGASDEAGPLARFSRSEVAVAELVAAGCTNREIGERLHISRRTVETHVAHAFQKLDVRTRAHLAAIVTASTR